MLSRSVLRSTTTSSSGPVARRAFHTSGPRLSSPYHYPTGPRSSIPFDPLKRGFAFKYWTFCAVGFGLPFGVAVWQTYKNGGDIICVREEPQHGQDKIEIVGSVDAGITAARWSPDEELLAIATRADTILFMSRQLESITDVTMTAGDLEASHHVNVGWGKAETQFKGKRAKALRDPTMPEKIDEGLLHSLDRGQVTITWRGDGAFFAISSVHEKRRRVIRVYSRDGILDSISEPVDYLQHSLSWRPAGNLIAAVQRLEDRIDVIFFERNGLRHGQFGLRLSPEEAKTWGSDIHLEWNNDSTVLAVCFKDRVQLWTMGNYHYYLKREILVAGEQDTASSQATIAAWHPEQALHVAMLSGDHIERQEYAFAPARGSTFFPHDLGLVAVVDGANLKVTPLRLANVPPPIAFHEITADSTIMDVAINRTGSRIAVITQEGLRIYNCDWTTRSTSRSEPSQHIPNLPEKPRPEKIAFIGDSNLHWMSYGSAGPTLSRLDLSSGKDSTACLTWTLPPGIIHIFSRSDHERICTRSASGLIAEVEIGAEDLHLRETTRLPSKTPWVEVVQQEDQSIAFGLSSNGTLYANERQLLRNCTSFLVTRAHLIFTTSQHLLKFVHMTSVDQLDVPSDEPEKDERCRSIERGARLITVMPTTFSLTLQMPRGNLETIFPRALVLAGIRRSIDDKDYRTAFLACRNHRVDMNILHDHAPLQFMSETGLFVDQIKKVEHIDLFLSQLREEDVAQTMYRETLPATERRDQMQDGIDTNETTQTSSAAVQNVSKVDRICDALLGVLGTRLPSHLQNMITAHVCKIPPNLEEGLTLIGRLRQDDSALVEKAVEHICFLADSNKLYEHALGLYDLDLALLIAQQAQRDPREILPFLQRLESMEPLRKRFSIDDHLTRHAKALRYLRDLDAFDELKVYTTRHELYKDALDIYRYDDRRLNEIMSLYAEYLNSNSRHKEAGIAYEYLSQHDQAMEAYQAAGSWREALFCASQIPLEPQQLQDLTTALANALYEARDYYHAAVLQLEYQQDVQTAAATFCKGYFFADAMRVVGSKGRSDLLEEVIDPGLAEGLATSTELLAECKGQLNAQVPRLRELRAKKEEDPLAYYDAPTTTSDIPDNISLAGTEASTSGSLYTRYTSRTGTNSSLNTHTTRRTSKNRRREERKRARGKKGSVYEAEYLVNSIRRLMQRVDSVREEVERLREGLLRRGMRERALAVERAMVEVVELCRGCVEEVFGTVGREGVGDGQVGDVTGEGEDERANIGDMPVMKEFERLSLLGGE
ncbi:MAG: hypothetical protein M1817_003984 [Caeruleum heppii]|nr:MAG: hypothetical protein M1817_003984 [Caeruleum heppii]